MQTWPIGQAEVLCLVGQLHIVDRRTPRREQVFRLRQGKGEARAAVSCTIGIDFLNEACRQCGKGAGLTLRTVGRFRQCRLTLDIGNGVPQRGKALLAVGGLHDETVY